MIKCDIRHGNVCISPNLAWKWIIMVFVKFVCEMVMQRFCMSRVGSVHGRADHLHGHSRKDNTKWKWPGGIHGRASRQHGRAGCLHRPYSS